MSSCQTRGGDGPVSPLCSRNARPPKALVGRAQRGTHPGHPEETENKRVWKEHLYCSMRAVKDGAPGAVGGAMHRPVSQLRDGGFTLIEVLLAVSLVALMATLVFGSLYVTTSAMDAARAASANEQIVRSTLRVMADELSLAKDSSAGRWIGMNGQVDGQPADTVAFQTIGQFSGATSTKGTEQVRIVYTREGELLLRFVRNNLYGLTDESVERVELARKVKGFNVRYFDRTSKVWVDEWPATARQAPKVILLELTLLQENAEPQTIRQWVTVGAS